MTYATLPRPSQLIAHAYEQIAMWEGNVAETREAMARTIRFDFSARRASQERSLESWRRELVKAEESASRPDLITAWDFVLARFESQGADRNHGNKDILLKLHGELVERYADLLMGDPERVRAAEAHPMAAA